MLVALGRLQRPFDQDADPTHVTGSAVVLGKRGVLLHRHKRLGIWLQPGGHLEAGETPVGRGPARGATRRPAFRCDLSPPGRRPGPARLWLHLDVHDGGRGHTHLDLRYRLEAEGDDTPAPQAGESQEVRWFSWPEALRRRRPRARRTCCRTCRPLTPGLLRLSQAATPE